MIYTIFGIYPDTQQRHADSVEADSANQAEVLYRHEHGDMLIAATVEGDITPSDSLTYAWE